MEDLLPSQVRELEQLVAGSRLADVLRWGTRPGDFAGYVTSSVPALCADTPDVDYCFAITSVPREILARWAHSPRRGGGDFWVMISPSHQRVSEVFRELTWAEVTKLCGEWLDHLARELQAMNLWDLLADTELPAPPEPAVGDDETFSEDEVRRLEAGLELAESQIVEEITAIDAMDDVQELRSFVQTEFAALRAELRKQNRRGWARSFVGTAATLAIKLGDHWPRMVPFFEGVAVILRRVAEQAHVLLPP